MPLANTILAGAQKSGTTALCRFLGAHPQCKISDPKEPNFFSRAANLSRFSSYARCFNTARPWHHVLVDASTTYMADPAIAPRIRLHLGANTKIIFVLRSPSARAYSGFLHMLKRGHDRRRADDVFLSLSEDPDTATRLERDALERAKARGLIADRPYRAIYDDVLWNYRYVGNSMYAPLVNNYVQCFGVDNVLILLFEDVICDIHVVRRALGGFLGVDPDLFPTVIPKSNQTTVAKITTPWGFAIEQARWIKRGNYTLVRPRELSASPPHPSPAVRDLLRRLFEHEVAYWSQYVRRDLRSIGWS